jgi:hypothetical protein
MPKEYRFDKICFGIDNDEAKNSPSLPVKSRWALTYQNISVYWLNCTGSIKLSNYTDSNYALQTVAWSAII